MVDTYIVDKDGNQANAASVTVPANRDFRGAWSLSGSVISEDMDAAKEIFKDKVREVRAPLLEAKDGIGDMLVTIILLAKMLNMDSVDCLQSAYDVIKKRTGKMVNGQFVKDN